MTCPIFSQYPSKSPPKSNRPASIRCLLPNRCFTQFDGLRLNSITVDLTSSSSITLATTRPKLSPHTTTSVLPPVLKSSVALAVYFPMLRRAMIVTSGKNKLRRSLKKMKTRSRDWTPNSINTLMRSVSYSLISGRPTTANNECALRPSAHIHTCIDPRPGGESILARRWLPSTRAASGMHPVGWTVK